jgi:membrane-associated phospholipid phosphatase
MVSLATTKSRWTADGGRASKREITFLVAYFSGLVALTDVLNVRLGVELLTLAVLVAAAAITRQFVRFLRDWWFYLAGLLLWNLSGPVAAASPFPAHLGFMLSVDRFLFGGHVPAVVLQHNLAARGSVNGWDIATSLAYNLHLTEPYIAGYFLWRIDRVVYFQFAAAVLSLLVLGFLTFILFPAIPPWMASIRFHQIPGVSNRFGAALHANPLPFHGTPLFYVFRFRGDAVAAFPSEHAALPMLELLAFHAAIGRRAWPFVLWLAWVLFSIIYLGEHWVTDAIAGYLYAIVIFVSIRAFTGGRPMV